MVMLTRNKNSQSNKQLAVEAIDLDVVSLDEIHEDPIDVDAIKDVNLEYKITTKVINSSQVQIEYIFNNTKSKVIYDFVDEQEQLSLKDLIPGTDTEMYVSRDGSINIHACDPKLQLDVTSEATISNSAAFSCKQLKLNATSLELKHDITTKQNCSLIYSQQLNNQAKLTIEGILNCQGAKLAILTNNGTIIVNKYIWFNEKNIATAKIINQGLINAQQGIIFKAKQLHNNGTIVTADTIISFGKQLFNQGIILAGRQLNFSYRGYLVNRKSGVIVSGEALYLRRHDYHDPIDVDELPPTSTLINQGKVISFNKLTLLDNTGIIFNEQQGLLKAEALHVVGDQFINAGEVQTKTYLKVVLSAINGYWYNKETGMVHANQLICSLDQLINNGNIYAQQEISSILQKLKNKAQGKIISETTIRLSALEKIINDCIIQAKEELTLYSNLTVNNANSRLTANKVKLSSQHLVNSGAITAKQTNVIVATLLDNLASGRISSASQLRLAIEQQLHNHSILQSETAVITSGNQVVNSNAGVISATKQANIVAPTINNEGNIDAPELNLTAIYEFNHAATAKIVANLATISGDNFSLSGELATKVAMVLEANKKIIVNANANLASEDKLKITTNELMNAGNIFASTATIKSNEMVNTGDITADDLSLQVDVIKNLYNAIIFGTSKLILDTKQLQNAGAIAAYGQLQLKLLNCLENLQSGKITAVQHLFVDACGIVKNSGLISSEATALIKLGDVLENYNTGVIEAKEFSLKGVWGINNWGKISGQDKLYLEISGIINNYQSGSISSQSALELIGNNLDNHGSIQSNQLKLFFHNILKNHESGNITATEAMDFVGAKLMLNAGEITSQQNIDVKCTLALENLESGKITAAAGLNAIADLLVANCGQVKANNMQLAAAKLLLNGKIDSKSLQGKAEIITSDGELNTGATDLTADLVQIDGSLNASSLAIEAKNYLHLLKNGKISCTEASTLLSKAGFINLGKILNSAPLSIIAKDLFHDRSANLEARHDLYLKAINLYLEGELQASNNLFLLVENRFEYQTVTLKADGELHLTLANDLQVKHNINTPGGLELPSNFVYSIIRQPHLCF